MASALFSSIQSLSTNLLKVIRGTPSSSHQQQDPPSPVTEQQKSVREDLEKLSRMLARIQAVQQDAEEREIDECSVRLWLAELRGVAYKTEDVLEEFNYEVLRSIVESGDAAMEAYHRDGGTKRKIAEMYASSSLASYSVTNTKASIPDGMAEKIKSITERFEEISKARKDLKLREEDGPRLVIKPQIRLPTSSHVDEKAIFGREKDKEKIISLLNPSTGPDFMVLPIVGMGGFGKTTLAQLVFNDSKIHGLFNNRCWVCVSDDFDPVRLTKAIIDSLSEKPCEFSELSELQDVLKEKISGHGLFLVLDDVWNEQRNLWERFRVGFLGAKFVRILTTTRNTSIAKIMQTTSHFQLSSLPEENCWSLFKHFAFGSRETSENANLHEIGHGIVKKCKGSPLAIKALGGILRYEMDEVKWREILESDISAIDEMGEVKPALKLSYQKLPQHLKPCFLYLSMFPKDFNFEKDMVIRLWMAQGYINGNTRNLKTLEEIGSEYFDELQGRSLVDGGPSSYILHDLIHDLARSVSQEAYWPVVENDHGYNGVCKVCHLYFTKKDELLGLVPSTYKSIRTLGKCRMAREFDFSIFSEIACARALHLEYSSLPNTFGMFKHLRYLFVLDNIEVLPETLCLLYNLQTLVLDTFYLEELPENMKNLINLRCFKLFSCAIQHLPESFFPLPNLQTLSFICDQIEELPRGIEQSTRLHFLGLPAFLTNVPSGIGKLPTLQHLWGDFSGMDHEINGWLREIKDMNKLRGPLCISGLRNIVDVELFRNAKLASKPNLHELNLNFQEDCAMEYFRDDEELCEALHLHLTCCSSNNAKSENDEKIHNVVLGSLQPHGNLTELRILNYGGRNFPSWLHNPLLPKLTTLTLNFCIEPNYLPPFGQLPHLRFLEISGGNLGDEPRTYSLWVEYDSSKQPKKPSYPSLKELLLRNMLNLVEWQANDGDFPCLEQLTIENCPKLVHVPLKDVLHSMIQMAEISNCPRLDLGKRYLYKKDPMVEALMLSANNEIRLFYDFSSVNFQFPHLKIPLFEIPFTLFFTKEDFREAQSLTREPWEGVSCQHIKLNLASLAKLEIVGCTNVISVIGLDNLSSLKHLYISDCPELCNWKDKTLPVSLESLQLNYCPKLSSLPLLSVQNHSSTLKVLAIIQCPRLAVLEGFHGPMKLNTMNLLHCEIYDCPRLYLGERYVYERDPMAEALMLFSNNEIRLFNDYSSVNFQFPRFTIPLLEIPFTLFLTKEDFRGAESLTREPWEGVSCQHIKLNLASLVKLEIVGCTNIISVIGLDNLSSLKHLYISVCPELCNWKDKTLPVSLESLELNYCPKLSSLPLLSVQNHSSTLKVLAIIKCPRLAVLEGFHGLMKLNTMNLLHCEIYDCPGLYLGERYVYQRDTTIKELNLSGNNEIHLLDSRIPLLENQFELFLTKEDFQEVESLTCAPSVGVSCQHVILNLASLVILEIMRCTKVISVTGLDNLSSLKHLYISDCPELCNWKDKTLPVSLESLQLNYCPKLSSLPLLSVQNHSLLLTIHDCMLMRDWCHRNSITYCEL